MAFVSGGIQKSVLQLRQEQADRGETPTANQYETIKDGSKSDKTISYEIKMKNAQAVIDRQKTNVLLEAVNARTQENRAEYDARKEYNIKQALQKDAQTLNDDRIIGKEYIDALQRYGAAGRKHAHQRDLNTVLAEQQGGVPIEKEEHKRELSERDRSGSKGKSSSSRRRSRSRDRDRRRRRSRSRSRDRESSSRHRRRRSRSRDKDRKRHGSRRSRSRSPKRKSIFQDPPKEYNKGVSDAAKSYLGAKDQAPTTINNYGQSLRIKGADFEQYGDQATKALTAHQKYTDAEGYVTATSGFRYIPRDPNAPIPHAEVKGWLHCWCQTKQFDKPVYELTEEGKAPYKKYTVKLTVKTKTGVELDIKPVVVANSKKVAMQNAAWTFVDELISRGLLEESHAPPRQNYNATEEMAVGEITGLDVSPQATYQGGGWTLTNCILRLRRFCSAIKAPLDIQIHAYGPDHDRKTDAHCVIKFQVRGEKEERVYQTNHTTKNRKQAQAAVALTLMRALYKDGFIEANRAPMMRPPMVDFTKSGSGLMAEATTEELKEINETFGGWIPSNSEMGLKNILRNWDISQEALSCECLGRTGGDQFLVFKAELRLTLVMTTMAQLTTRHELFAYGRDRSKKEARDNCASMMMRQLFKFGIVLNSTWSTNKPGPNAHMWEIRPGPVGAAYSNSDIYVTNKLNELRPAPDELNHPSTILSHIEAALKCVSDWIHEEEIYQEYSHALNNKRTLLGMQRVGPIAMDMMLTNERRAHVVVTCGRRPTDKLLQLVAGKTIQMLLYTERGFTNYSKRMEELRNYHKKMDQLEEAKRAAKEEEERKKLELEALIEQQKQEAIKKEEESRNAAIAAMKKAKEQREKAKKALEEMERLDQEASGTEEKKLDETKENDEAKENSEAKQNDEAKEKETEPEELEPMQTDESAVQKRSESVSESESEKPTGQEVPTNFAEERAKQLAEENTENRQEQNGLTDAANWDSIENDRKQDISEKALDSSNGNDKNTQDSQVQKTNESQPTNEESNQKLGQATKLGIPPPSFMKDGGIKIDTTEPKEPRADPDYYQIQMEPTNSGYLVTYGIIAPAKMVVRVTLTSNVLRQDLSLKKREKAEKKAELERIANKDEPEFKRLKAEKKEAGLLPPQEPNDQNGVITEASGTAEQKDPSGEVKEKDAPGTIGDIEKPETVQDNPEQEAKDKQQMDEMEVTEEPPKTPTPSEGEADKETSKNGEQKDQDKEKGPEITGSQPPTYVPIGQDKPPQAKPWDKLSIQETDDQPNANQKPNYHPLSDKLNQPKNEANGQPKNETGVKNEDVKGEVKVVPWLGVAPMMPSADDHARFKFGPYFKNMSLEECEIIEQENGRLPAQPGLGALAELRRIKWYQHVGLNTPYLPDICRLIRGLAVREPSWRPFRILCPWTIALILEILIRYEIRENCNTAITLSPGRVLRLCLEAIAKGFRFPVLRLLGF